jgi:hypothetical protein
MVLIYQNFWSQGHFLISFFIDLEYLHFTALQNCHSEAYRIQSLFTPWRAINSNKLQKGFLLAGFIFLSGKALKARISYSCQRPGILTFILPFPAFIL